MNMTTQQWWQSKPRKGQYFSNLQQSIMEIISTFNRSPICYLSKLSLCKNIEPMQLFIAQFMFLNEIYID